MWDYQKTFEKIKEILETHLKGQVNEFENGTHLTISGSEIWISTESGEFTIGYGLPHTHYDPEYDSLNNALDDFINLLTKRKRVTLFLKGNMIYKVKTEIEIDNQKFREFGTSMTWFFPFWRKTTKIVIFENPVIEYSKIEKEIKDLKVLVK